MDYSSQVLQEKPGKSTENGVDKKAKVVTYCKIGIAAYYAYCN